MLPTSLAVRASGRVLNHGSGLADVWFELTGMFVLTAIYFAAGAALFTGRHCRVH